MCFAALKEHSERKSRMIQSSLNSIRDTEKIISSFHPLFTLDSAGDTMTVIDPDELDRCAILWTTVAYAIADLDELLPRQGSYPLSSTASSVWEQRITYSVVTFWAAILFL